MNFPEKADMTYIGPSGVVRQIKNVHPASKISELCSNYFRHLDEDDFDSDKGKACAIEFYEWLQSQPFISAETALTDMLKHVDKAYVLERGNPGEYQNAIAELTQRTNKDFALWIFAKGESEEGVIALCSEDPEAYLEQLVQKQMNQDPKDDSTAAFLANAVGLDFIFWLQKQVPFVLAENSRLAAEKAEAAAKAEKTETQEVDKNAVYFVASDSEFPEQIFFSWEDAVASEIRYLDSFNKAGHKVQSYMLNDDNQYTTDF